MTPTEWRQLRIEQTARAKAQIEGFESSEIFKASIEAKLREAGVAGAWFTNMQRCGRESFGLLCPCCGEYEEKHYQCSNRICPSCNWRVAGRRRDLLEKITRGLPEKILHVVVTQRNFYTDLRSEIRKSRANLLKLRRQSIFTKISGGCASLELTNEGRGWHLHWHLLVAATGFVGSDKLAVAWGELVGQDYAIVKIKPVKEGSYLQEVCKYAAKPSEVAKWPAARVAEFVEACRGTRMFTVFGKFAEMRKYAANVLAAEKKLNNARPCACGETVKVFGHDLSHCQRMLERGYW